MNECMLPGCHDPVADSCGSCCWAHCLHGEEVQPQARCGHEWCAYGEECAAYSPVEVYA